MAVRDRLHRSELAVPGSNTRAMEKAPGLGADVVFLDLEDAVAPDDKEQARENVTAAQPSRPGSTRSSVMIVPARLDIFTGSPSRSRFTSWPMSTSTVAGSSPKAAATALSRWM